LNPDSVNIRFFLKGWRAMAGRLVLGLALLLPPPCQARAPGHSVAGDMVAPWMNVTAVVVVGANANDARSPLVQDARAFWNRSFVALGSAFRLGPVTQATERVKELAARPVTSPLSRGEVGIRALARGVRVDFKVFLRRASGCTTVKRSAPQPSPRKRGEEESCGCDLGNA
jgi:hypothetical protein